MDATEVHLWASRVHSAKHLSAVHSAHLTSSDSEVNEDPRTYFTCPFCYADTELSLLCRHLQEEHCFDVKDAVCPVCALNLGKDVVGHFEVHHANSLKNRRKSQKSSFWNSSSVRELTSFYGFTTRSDRVNAHDSSPDPVLSPFICRVPHLQVKGEPSRNTCSITDASITLEIERSYYCGSVICADLISQLCKKLCHDSSLWPLCYTTTNKYVAGLLHMHYV